MATLVPSSRRCYVPAEGGEDIAYIFTNRLGCSRLAAAELAIHPRSGIACPTLKIDIVTLFPQVCVAPLGESIMGRAQAQGLLDLTIHDLRPFGTGSYRKCDDIPYGGGQGM